jgi:hypothetical protein
MFGQRDNLGTWGEDQLGLYSSSAKRRRVAFPRHASRSRSRSTARLRIRDVSSEDEDEVFMVGGGLKQDISHVKKSIAMLRRSGNTSKLRQRQQELAELEKQFEKQLVPTSDEEEEKVSEDDEGEEDLELHRQKSKIKRRSSKEEAEFEAEDGLAIDDEDEEDVRPGVRKNVQSNKKGTARAEEVVQVPMGRDELKRVVLEHVFDNDQHRDMVQQFFLDIRDHGSKKQEDQLLSKMSKTKKFNSKAYSQYEEIGQDEKWQWDKEKADMMIELYTLLRSWYFDNDKKTSVLHKLWMYNKRSPGKHAKMTSDAYAAIHDLVQKVNGPEPPKKKKKGSDEDEDEEDEEEPTYAKFGLKARISCKSAYTCMRGYLGVPGMFHHLPDKLAGTFMLYLRAFIDTTTSSRTYDQRIKFGFGQTVHRGLRQHFDGSLISAPDEKKTNSATVRRLGNTVNSALHVTMWIPDVIKMTNVEHARRAREDKASDPVKLSRPVILEKRMQMVIEAEVLMALLTAFNSSHEWKPMFKQSVERAKHVDKELRHRSPISSTTEETKALRTLAAHLTLLVMLNTGLRKSDVLSISLIQRVFWDPLDVRLKNEEEQPEHFPVDHDQGDDGSVEEFAKTVEVSKEDIAAKEKRVVERAAEVFKVRTHHVLVKRLAKAKDTNLKEDAAGVSVRYILGGDEVEHVQTQVTTLRDIFFTSAQQKEQYEYWRKSGGRLTSPQYYKNAGALIDSVRVTYFPKETIKWGSHTLRAIYIAESFDRYRHPFEEKIHFVRRVFSHANLSASAAYTFVYLQETRDHTDEDSGVSWGKRVLKRLEELAITEQRLIALEEKYKAIDRRGAFDYVHKRRATDAEKIAWVQEGVDYLRANLPPTQKVSWAALRNIGFGNRYITLYGKANPTWNERNRNKKPKK